MQPATACASSGLTIPWLRRCSSLRVKCSTSQRAHCASTSTADTAEPIEPIEPIDPIETDPEPDPEPFKLKPLPYPFNALEPHMSKETVEYHWERHHRGHVDSLNAIIQGTEFAEMELENMVLTSYNEGNPLPFFVHASQVWNHDFFWETMKPGGGGNPSNVLKYLIERDFGSLDELAKEIQNAALTQFGSGWVWLAYKAHRLGVGNDINPRPSKKDKRLVVVKTPNAVSPLVWDYYPLLAIDVWEHAYYMDYENRRGDYVSVFLDKLISWDVVSDRLKNAMFRASKREKMEKREMLLDKMKEAKLRVKAVDLRPTPKARPKMKRRQY
ncbi:Superoxide dismutase [Rhynchospora pubera]|uniref:superoxide dismutase n=1 Tax=Rhynchospora pubera TaxID=906938 RepID=A0AAV8F1H2_9POAL|nr:Superoxide dismutase [Rhynchospora pubera]